MYRIFKFSLALLCLSAITYAQKAPIKFGKVDDADLKMTTYVPDSSASAVILADYGVSSIEYHTSIGYYMLFNRHVRIKILTKDGYDWADHEVALYHSGSDGETIQGLKGATYNLVGGKVKATKLNRKSMFMEKTNDNWDKAKFTMPDVKEGSVIEYSYGVRSPFIVNLQDWEFQSTIPTRWSEFIVKIPEYFHFERLLQGYHPMSINEQSQTMADTYGDKHTRFDNRWVAKDVPAFRKEPYMSSSKNYLTQLKFELAYVQYPGGKRNIYMGTWQDINDTYLSAQTFGGQLNNTPMLKDKVQELIAGASTDEQKISAIANFVREHVTWDGKYRTLVSQDLRKVYQDKVGSSADINLMLVNMLRKAGLQADPVLLSTRNNGFIREEFPLSSQFNYVIASVNKGDGVVLLDATDKVLPHNLLPERCLNGKGMRISKSNAGWVPLEHRAGRSTVVSANLEMNDGVIQGVTDMRFDGYSAYSERESYIEEPDNYEKSIEERYGWEIDKSEVNQIEELNKPVSAHFEFKTSNDVESLGELIYFNPIVTAKLEENPFKTENRKYPVDFVSPIKYSYNMMFKIPEGYAVDGLPKSEVVELPNSGGKFSYILRQGDGMISLRSQLNIDRPIFSGPEYQYLKAFYAKVVEKQNEMVVLKKTN